MSKVWFGLQRPQNNHVRGSVLALFFTLTGCISTESIMRSWQGRHIEDLITSWGAPTSQSQLKDGRTLYSWISNWGSAYMMNTCRQSFITDTIGIIEVWRFAGCPQWQTAPPSIRWLQPKPINNSQPTKSI